MLAAIQVTAANAIGGGTNPPPVTQWCLDCGVFAVDNDLDHDAEAAIVFNMTRWLAALPGVALPSSSTLNAAGIGMPNAEQFSVNAAAIQNAVLAGNAGAGYTVAAIPNTEQMNYALMCAAGGAHGIQYALDLIACYQVKPLKIKNIKGYFMSQDGTKVGGAAIRDWLEPVARLVPFLVADGIVRPVLTQNKFMTYHLGFSSTAAILTEMIGFLGATAAQLLAPGTILAINNSNGAPYSQQLNALIPEISILAGMAYSRALAKDIGEWYQGAHAKASHPASVYNSYFAFFSRLSALSDASAAILLGANAAAVFLAMPANLLGI
jgi:hypothetical protein